jgi:hypothetical protein
LFLSADCFACLVGVGSINCLLMQGKLTEGTASVQLTSTVM